jgi:hypothetical protein
MTEAELQSAVLELAGWLKLSCYHTRDSRRSQKGFPDLVIVGRSVLWAELKSETGETSASQDLWAWKLTQAGQQWRLWRPADWQDGTIRAELARLAP